MEQEDFGLDIFFDDPIDPIDTGSANTQELENDTENASNSDKVQEIVFDSKSVETGDKTKRESNSEAEPKTTTQDAEIEYDEVAAKDYFDFLKSNNLIIVGDDFEFDGTPEKLQEAHDKTIEVYKESAYTAIMSALPENLQDLLQYALSGGDDYDQFLNKDKSFDTESQEGQEAVIRFFYKNTANWDDRKIDRYIAKLDEDELLEEALDLNAQIEVAQSEARKAAVQAEEDNKKKAIESHKAFQANIAQTIDKAGYIEQSRKSNIKNFMFNPVRRSDGQLTEYQRTLQSIQSNPDHLAQLADLLFDYDKDKGISYTRFEKSAKTTLTKDLKRQLESSTSSKVHGINIPSRANLKASQANRNEEIDWKAFLGS